MPDKPRYYVTTAIAYPNGAPHIGYAYEVMATDAIARFMRLDGYDVFFLTGTDEHGIKMLQTATKERLTPRELIARNVPRFQAMAERLNCSNDDFIRTTEPRHHLSAAAIWQRMEQAGDIYLSKKCRSRSAMWSIRLRWLMPMGSISCATFSCAKCRSGRTAITAMRRSWRASTPT